jgi:hypothetical protein
VFSSAQEDALKRPFALFTLALLAGSLGLQAACSSGTSTGTGGSVTTAQTTTTTGTTSTTTSSTSTTSTTTTTTTGTGGSAADAGSDGGGNLCVTTGGTVMMQNCCASQGDFPNSCTIGTCTCSPGNLHMVQACQCPVGKCYDPTKGCTGGA